MIPESERDAAVAEGGTAATPESSTRQAPRQHPSAGASSTPVPPVPASVAGASAESAVDRFAALAGLVPFGVLLLDNGGRCVDANAAWARLSGLEPERSRGTGWRAALHPEDAATTLAELDAALAERRVLRRELRLRPEGERSARVSLRATAMTDVDGAPSGALLVVEDVGTRRRAERLLWRMTRRDALTGLLNRPFFLDRLSQALASSGRRGNVGLLALDLDGFRAVNDTLGHEAGDELLRQAAARLAETVRDEDTVARLGGDEFTVMLPQIGDAIDAGIVAEKIVRRLRRPFLIGGREVLISASVGIAAGSRANADGETLIRQADIALSRAKESGRARHLFFTPELDDAHRERSLLVTSLRRAVDRHDFELHYQPQLSIRRQRLAGFEALLRWPHGGAGHIPPQDFIDVLEDTGLISDVGQWAIDEACRQYAAWRARGLVDDDATMSVNVSPRQLGLPDFVQSVGHILERRGVEPARLTLELTESTLVRAAESSVVAELKALGVQISLDDFGTGYSSLAYLGHLPLDHLKIDRSFIGGIGKGADDQVAVTIVRSIIALARTLGIGVVAEGVEDAYVLPLLSAEGCECYQGYHFSAPLPPEGIERLLGSLDPVRLAHFANFVDLGDARPSLAAD